VSRIPAALADGAVVQAGCHHGKVANPKMDCFFFSFFGQMLEAEIEHCLCRGQRIRANRSHWRPYSKVLGMVLESGE
jgi:hypothetical protein